MKTEFMDYIYPSIGDKLKAKEVAKFGAMVAAILAAITLFSLVTSIGNQTNDVLVELLSGIVGNTIPMILVSVFLMRMSRVAAVAGIVLVVAELVFKFAESGSVGIFPFVLLVFVNATRATFAFHKFESSNEGHNE